MAKARDLSPDLQDAIARLMPAFVGEEGSVYRFTPEEEAEVDESEARGDYATEAEIRAVWAKDRLQEPV
ncbi:hypothetical protein [Methylobacterium sp. P5_C11]